MAIKVKSIKLWRKEMENWPGALAAALEPIARSGADLGVVMAYRYARDETRGAIEVYPVSGKKAVAAAMSAGLSASSIPALLVEGDNKPAIGHACARAIADAGINMSFVVTQVIGRKYAAVFGFETDADASKATSLIKKAVATKKGK